MQGRVSYFGLCWSQGVSGMGLSAPSSSLIPDVDAVVHSPTHSEDSLPPNLKIKCQILKSSLGLEVLIFLYLFLWKKRSKTRREKGLVDASALTVSSAVAVLTAGGSRSWIINQPNIKILRQIEVMVTVNQILPLGFFCAEAAAAWRRWVGLMAAPPFATEMSCEWAAQRDF